MSNNNYDNQGYSEENPNNTIRKKRRRRPNVEESNEPIPEVQVQEQSDIPKREHRRRRRKEPRNSEGNNQNGPLGITAYLEDLQDDIEVKVNSEDLPTVDAITTSKAKPVASQGTGDKVYIEGARTFRAENHDKYMKNQLKMSQRQAEKLSIYQNQYDNDLLQCSIGVTERFRIFATFLHGLFAGMTLIHMIFSLTIGGTAAASQQTFLTSYAILQQPLSIYNYVAFIIILISLWDRMDMGQISRKCGPSQAGIFVALILAMISFIINNCQYFYNQDFNNFNANNSRVYLTTLATSYDTWRILDAVKSVLICVSWFIVALIPVYDRFVEHLNECLVQDLNENY